LAALPEAERRTVGGAANAARRTLEEAIEVRRRDLSAAATPADTGAAWVDLTFPTTLRRGHRHPITQALAEIERIFATLGYRRYEGPEIEYEELNFEMLNLPEGHPARDQQDSFYIDRGILLRTHTSPGQIRAMRDWGAPLAVIVPGRTYRRDELDASHGSTFHQVEGLHVDEGVTLADLKGTLEYFSRSWFGADRRIRLLPDHFPFTEPSLQAAVSCGLCDGAGCRSCGYEGWLEILGAGLVHPQVLRHGGVDPSRHTGFAFGMGVERLVMLRHGVDDLRLFLESDVRFLEQF
jgi:phenylalanyl-tRNA synthetase alpha chain